MKRLKKQLQPRNSIFIRYEYYKIEAYHIACDSSADYADAAPSIPVPNRCGQGQGEKDDVEY